MTSYLKKLRTNDLSANEIKCSSKSKFILSILFVLACHHLYRYFTFNINLFQEKPKD